MKLIFIDLEDINGVHHFVNSNHIVSLLPQGDKSTKIVLSNGEIIHMTWKTDLLIEEINSYIQSED